MRIGIVGSRNYENTDNVYIELTNILTDYVLPYHKREDITIVSGGAIGVDTIAEQYAERWKLKTDIYKPDYETYNKAAPIIRNTDIVDNSDLIIAFWNGSSKGTLDTIIKAARYGKRTIIVGDKYD